MATLLLLSACAGPARVGDVWRSKHVATIGEADRSMFVSDRASRLNIESVPLPADAQREEFEVTWRGAGARALKFEYRQVNVPDTIVAVTVPALASRRHVFEVRGEEFHQGGPVSAWRASLWDGDRLLDEKLSVLW